MRIECGGLNAAAEDEDAAELYSLQAAAADFRIPDTSDEAQADVRAMKCELLEILLANGVATLSARADGSGDEGGLEELHCYVEASPEQYEECDVPDRVEALVEQILAAAEDRGAVNFNGDGGFWEITITTATRECAIECGWYYTTSESTTASETL